MLNDVPNEGHNMPDVAHYTTYHNNLASGHKVVKISLNYGSK